MKDSSKKEEDTQKSKQEGEMWTEEKWQEVLGRKGVKVVWNSRKDITVILNPHPELVRKLRESLN